MDSYPRFTQTHANVPLRNMRDIRNRIAHGYYEINLEVVWDTVQTALPVLLDQLRAAHTAANGSRAA